MTVPNLLSILRILLVPVFIIYMLNNRMLASLSFLSLPALAMPLMDS